MSTREIHDLEVSLDLTCTRKAGNCGYCNRVICLVLELARYSLEELGVPEEAACTSMSRKWCVPGKILIDFLIT